MKTPEKKTDAAAHDRRLEQNAMAMQVIAKLAEERRKFDEVAMNAIITLAEV